MKYLDRLVTGRKAFTPEPFSWAVPSYGGVSTGDREAIDTDFEGYVREVYKRSGVVFAVQTARSLILSQARFLWRDRGANGAFGDLYGTAELGLLEKPWPNGATADLLTRMDQDATIGGNFYATTADDLGNLGAASRGGPGRRIVRMRPSQVKCVLGSFSGDPDDLDSRPLGYVWTHPTTRTEVLLAASEVTHYAPHPDPDARWRGMSWLTPILDEVLGDRDAVKHKRMFFKNGAQTGQVVVFDPSVKPELVDDFKVKFLAQHRGVANAYKTLFLGGGADLKSMSIDWRAMDFKNIQGMGETRIAAAAGVPPVIVGLSEGLQSATYSNYAQARRRFADGTLRPLWGMAATSLQTLLVPNSPASGLWYDDRDIAFLREDVKDVVEIQAAEAQTIRNLLDAGFVPASVIDAVRSGDWTLLRHSGLFSVQLQKPGDTGTPAPPKAVNGHQDVKDALDLDAIRTALAARS